VGVQILNAPNGPVRGLHRSSWHGPGRPQRRCEALSDPANTMFCLQQKNRPRLPLQVNDIRPGTNPPQPTNATNRQNKRNPRPTQSEESSSKKKKKKGLAKLNPF
jgi:hypothetical protein